MVPTVVLLHGQPDSSASFWGLRRELGPRLLGVRVLAPDRPGYGANPLPATDYHGNADWLRDWLIEIDAGPVVLVGHSWAGGIATLLAAAGPPGLVGLVLLAAVGPACLLPIDPVLAAPVLGEIISFAALKIGGPLVRRQAAKTLEAQLPTVDLPYARASGLAMGHRPLWRAFLTEQRALVRELGAIEAALPRIAVPTLVVHGDADPIIPDQTPDELARRIPGAVEVEVEGGHDLQLRQPAAVAGVIGPFAAPLLAPAARAD